MVVFRLLLVADTGLCWHLADLNAQDVVFCTSTMFCYTYVMQGPECDQLNMTLYSINISFGNASPITNVILELNNKDDIIN